MDPIELSNPLNNDLADIESQLARLRNRLEDDRRNTKDEVTLKDAEIKRLSDELQETKNRSDGVRKEFLVMRTREILWRCLARIKMTKLDETDKLYNRTNLELQKKTEMNQDLLKVVQESVRFADDLKATATDDKEKIKRIQEELSLQICASGRETDSLKSQIAGLRRQIEDKQRDLDSIDNERQQCEEERRKLSGQLSVAQQTVTLLQKEIGFIHEKLAVLEIQNKQLEGNMRARAEECLLWRNRAEVCENLAQHQEALPIQRSVVEQLEGETQEPRASNGQDISTSCNGDNM